MSMPRVKIGRWESKGGTPALNVPYAGWIEPEDRRWIVLIGLDGTPTFHAHRDPETGVVLDAGLSAYALGPTSEMLESAHAIGATVHVVFNGGTTSPGYVVGAVSAVTFTDYGKVLYDVRVPVDGGPDETEIHRVDSAFVLPPPPSSGQPGPE